MAEVLPTVETESDNDIMKAKQQVLQRACKRRQLSTNSSKKVLVKLLKDAGFSGRQAAAGEFWSMVLRAGAQNKRVTENRTGVLTNSSSLPRYWRPSARQSCDCLAPAT